jgi:hypothetical protein
MGEFTQTFAAANGLTMSELIRQALAQYMDYELKDTDADPPKQQKARIKAVKDPNALSKRQIAINAAITQARENERKRKEAVASRLAEGIAV